MKNLITLVVLAIVLGCGDDDSVAGTAGSGGAGGAGGTGGQEFSRTHRS